VHRPRRLEAEGGARFLDGEGGPSSGRQSQAIADQGTVFVRTGDGGELEIVAGGLQKRAEIVEGGVHPSGFDATDRGLRHMCGGRQLPLGHAGAAA
jgi:hypothetical protein